MDESLPTGQQGDERDKRDERGDAHDADQVDGRPEERESRAEQMREPALTRSERFRLWLLKVGLVAPKDQPDPWSHRRGEPRGFAVIWMGFLLVSTLTVFLSFGEPMRVTAEGFREGARVLITVIAIGITVMWPMIRLCQRAPVGGGTVMVVKDLFILLVPLQAVLWPQVVITGWTAEAVAASDLLLVSWALIIGAFLALAMGPGRRVRAGEQKLEGDRSQARVGIERTYWMLSLIAIIGFGPVLLILLRAGGGVLGGEVELLFRMSSPLTAPWEMLRNRIWTGQHAIVSAQHWRAAWMTACLAASAWILVAILHGAGGRALASGRKSA